MYFEFRDAQCIQNHSFVLCALKMYLSVIECHKHNDSKLCCMRHGHKFLANNKSPTSDNIFTINRVR